MDSSKNSTAKTGPRKSKSAPAATADGSSSSTLETGLAQGAELTGARAAAEVDSSTGSNLEAALASTLTLDSGDTNAVSNSDCLEEGDEWEDTEVRFLIRRRADGCFRVYVDHKLEVRWDRRTDLFPEHKKMAVERLLARAQTDGAMPVPFLSDEQRQTKSRIIAQAVVLALMGDLPEARKNLDKAWEFMSAKAIEKARIWTVAGSIMSFLGLVLLFVGIAAFAGELQGSVIDIKHLAIAAIFGLIGSQFSLIQRAGTLPVSPLAGMGPHVVEAFSRILTGALAGIIMYVALRAQLLFGFIDHGTVKNASENAEGVAATKDSLENWTTWILVIVAGASERLIPSYLSTMELRAAGELTNIDEEPVNDKPEMKPLADTRRD